MSLVDKFFKNHCQPSDIKNENWIPVYYIKIGGYTSQLDAMRAAVAINDKFINGECSVVVQEGWHCRDGNGEVIAFSEKVPLIMKKL